MTLTTTAQQLAPFSPAPFSMASRAPRPCVVDHGYAWLAAGVPGLTAFETFQAINAKRPTRRLRRTLT